MHDLFSGSALVKVTPDGACTLPSGFGEVVQRRSGERMVLLGAHQAEPCLAGYDRTYAAQLLNEARQEVRGHVDLPLRRLFGTAEALPFTLRRRLVIPPFLRRKGRIQAHALFIGTGGSFEIWNPMAACSAADTELAEIAAWHLHCHGLQ